MIYSVLHAGKKIYCEPLSVARKSGSAGELILLGSDGIAYVATVPLVDLPNKPPELIRSAAETYKNVELCYGK